MTRFLSNRQSEFAPQEAPGRFVRRLSAMQEIEEQMGADTSRTRFAKVNRDLWGPVTPSAQNKKRGFKGGS